VRRRRLAGSTAGERRRGADVDAAAEEGAGRDDHAPRGEAAPLERLDAEDAPGFPVEQQRGDRPLDRLQRLVLLEERAHRAAVQPAVALRARRPDGGALPPVEHAELQRGEVGRPPHDPAERVHLPHDRPLRDAADGRIARHLADRLERARDERDARAEPRRGDGRLRSGVSGADDEHVEAILDETVGHGGVGERAGHEER
jgi:hypothetical protein